MTGRVRPIPQWTGEKWMKNGKNLFEKRQREWRDKMTGQVRQIPQNFQNKRLQKTTEGMRGHIKKNGTGYDGTRWRGRRLSMDYSTDDSQWKTRLDNSYTVAAFALYFTPTVAATTDIKICETFRFRFQFLRNSHPNWKQLKADFKFLRNACTNWNACKFLRNSHRNAWKIEMHVNSCEISS